MMNTENIKFNNSLLESLKNDSFLPLNNELKVNMYLTLLALNNNSYTEKMYLSEYDTVDDFLRKTNNLKIKIQLKRKSNEIEELATTINKLYLDNTTSIDKYNTDNLDIINILNTKDPKDLTHLVDEMTKIKLDIHNKKDRYDKIRRYIIDNIFTNNYYIKDDKLYLEKEEILLTDFYQIFSYLLDINNYKNIFNNDFHKNLIETIIDIITNNKECNTEVLIPVVLTYLLNKNINNSDIDTSKFKVENIKISDLYSFANKESNKNTAKWRNVFIPNDYLYNKIKEIVKKGMYYFDNNRFILESIVRKTSDFKLSIPSTDMKEFLIDNLTNEEI